MAFPTQSIGLASASSQAATRANTGSTGLGGLATNITFETWVKFTTLPSSGNSMVLASKWLTGGGGGDYSYIFWMDNNAGTYRMKMNTSAGGGTVNISSLSTGTWYHMAWVFTFSGTTYEAFLNGVSQGTSGSVGAIATTTSPFALGRQDTQDYLNGRMVMARFWTATRSSAQLLANQCTTLGSTANLSAEWTLDNTYNDNSGNSNTLTGVNTPTFTTDIPTTCASAGPANWKTWNTNVKANIKTLNTNTLANIKTYDTIT